MTTINNGESGLSVRNKINAIWEGLELNAIAASKAVTAVDVFVYDTSKDSDGGAWRKRTQATSWYQETLSTSTRGARREFPAVAVIVAEATKVTIYDGDDPDLPMWMVFEGGTGNALFNAFVTGLTSINGFLVASLNASLFVVSFLEDTLKIQQTGGTRMFFDPIAGRSSGNGYAAAQSGGEIVNNLVNDVAMTVLPDAPIDPATGLPVPTIAVATAGGVSVIKDDGTVADSADTTAYVNVYFENRGRLFAVRNNGLVRTDDDYSADGFAADATYSASTTPATLGTILEVVA